MGRFDPSTEVRTVGCPPCPPMPTRLPACQPRPLGDPSCHHTGQQKTPLRGADLHTWRIPTFGLESCLHACTPNLLAVIRPVASETGSPELHKGTLYDDDPHAKRVLCHSRWRRVEANPRQASDWPQPHRERPVRSASTGAGEPERTEDVAPGWQRRVGLAPTGAGQPRGLGLIRCGDRWRNARSSAAGCLATAWCDYSSNTVRGYRGPTAAASRKHRRNGCAACLSCRRTRPSRQPLAPACRCAPV